ncbi:MAG: chromate transporter [Lachnospiraceae bacterium]|nr:chromate transporter [Lachnospiraceae bacterium]
MKKRNLFFTFLKIGAFTFGGGYAMAALLEHEFVEKKKWISKEEFMDMVAIAESTPGPVAINSATFIGYKTEGVLGALLATVAVSIPSFVIIYLISLVFDCFLSLSYVAYAFKGIQVGVVYLIFSAGIKMAKGLKKDIFSRLILAAVFLLMTFFILTSVSFSSVFYILICGFLAVLLYLIRTAYGVSQTLKKNKDGKGGNEL